MAPGREGATSFSASAAPALPAPCKQLEEPLAPAPHARTDRRTDGWRRAARLPESTDILAWAQTVPRWRGGGPTPPAPLELLQPNTCGQPYIQQPRYILHSFQPRISSHLIGPAALSILQPQMYQVTRHNQQPCTASTPLYPATLCIQQIVSSNMHTQQTYISGNPTYPATLYIRQIVIFNNLYNLWTYKPATLYIQQHYKSCSPM